MLTKKQIILAAYDEIGVNIDEVEMQQDLISSAILQLNNMIASWLNSYIDIGYNFSSDPQKSNFDEESGLPIWANEAVIKNLAINICSSIGKSPNQELRVAASNCYRNLFNNTCSPNRSNSPTLPVGSGNYIDNVFGKKYFGYGCMCYNKKGGCNCL